MCVAVTKCPDRRLEGRARRERRGRNHLSSTGNVEPCGGNRGGISERVHESCRRTSASAMGSATSAMRVTVVRIIVGSDRIAVKYRLNAVYVAAGKLVFDETKIR